MMRMDLLPPPPKELQGMDLSVEYISVMAQAMKLTGITGIERFVAFAGQVAQAKPDVLDKIDFDQTLDEYASMVGTPPSIVKDDDTVAKIRKQRADQEAAMQQAAMAQQSAQTAKTLADTQITDDNAIGAMINQMRGVPA
jgi:beta-glucosidase/6-phospho-beta-glucosidase/beta-galactosidase